MLCVTSGAALNVALPAWSAAIVHVPAATPVTTLPETVQIVGVSELNVTARPELAVAVTVPVPPTVNVVAAPNVIV
jgi:hypothetical protein